MLLTGCSDDFFGDKTEQHDSNRIQLSGDIDQPVSYTHLQPSVYALMRRKYQEATGPLIVHRLDMATSGLMIVGGLR